MVSLRHREFLAIFALAFVAVTDQAGSLSAGTDGMLRETSALIDLNFTLGANSTVGANSRRSYDGLTIEYLPQRFAEFSTEEIALAFINALKLQGLEDSTESQTFYQFEDTEYPDGRITIRMDAILGAPSGKTTRSSIMTALALLPITLMEDDHLAGVEFFEIYQRRNLYRGFFNDFTAQSESQLGIKNHSATALSRKRSSNSYHMTVQDKTTTTVLSTSLSDDDFKLEVAFHLVGLPLPRVGFFSSIIMSIYRLGLPNEASASVDTAEMSDNGRPVWIFMRKRPESTYPFAVYHLFGLLEGIARYTVQQGIYGELVFDLFADGELVSGGCVTQALEWRRWCGGLRGEGLHGIEEGDFQAYRAP